MPEEARPQYKHLLAALDRPLDVAVIIAALATIPLTIVQEIAHGWRERTGPLPVRPRTGAPEGGPQLRGLRVRGVRRGGG